MDNDGKQMSQREMLQAIQEAVIRRQNGEDPQVDPRVKRQLGIEDRFPSPNINPRKPDPEAEANAKIEAAANRPGAIVPGGQYGGHTLSKKINPETGMPYFSDPEPVQEDPEAVALREMRMKMLQQASQTGKFR